MTTPPEAWSRLPSYFPIAEAIAGLFRPHVEVVIHDLATTSVAYIANPISKRRPGDSSLGDQPPENSLTQDVIGPYRKVNRDGRNLRSITAVIRDDDANPVALMCMNFDVSLLEQIGGQIASLAFLPGSLEPHAPLFHDNWRQSLERAMDDYEGLCGMAVAAMNTAQRIELLARLDKEGLLSIRNAPTIVAERIGISRAALYKHLKAIRGSKP